MGEAAQGYGQPNPYAQDTPYGNDQQYGQNNYEMQNYNSYGNSQQPNPAASTTSAPMSQQDFLNHVQSLRDEIKSLTGLGRDWPASPAYSQQHGWPGPRSARASCRADADPQHRDQRRHQVSGEGPGAHSRRVSQHQEHAARIAQDILPFGTGLVQEHRARLPA